MITESQAKELAKFYQIDEFTIKREYLQLIFLSYLFREKESEKIFFKGGTAIRFLFGSPRFSEDLDFSTTYSKEKIKQIVKKLESLLKKELLGLKILFLYSGKEGERYRIKYQDKDLKYPLVIRLDFYIVKKIRKTEVSPLITKFPIAVFPLISHLSPSEILKEKIDALSTRGKGRDFFDVWFLLEKGVKTDKKINKKLLIQKINRYPTEKLNRDLDKFLPLSQRGIGKMMKRRLIEEILNF
jgi:predicted nucleotidyltransferase component of viral defense system